MSDNDLEMIDIDKQDPDLQEKQTDNDNEINDGSVLLDDYSDIPPLQSDEIAEQIVNDGSESSLKIKYSFDGQDVIEGLVSIQNTIMLKKKLVYTVCLFVLFLVYMIDYTNIQSMILGCLSLFVIGVVWVAPLIHIKRFANQADEKKIELSMDIYPSLIKVTNSNNDTVSLSFKEQIENIIETQNLFVICAGKTRIFIIPKRSLDEEIVEFIREIFQVAVGNKFYSKV